MNRSKDRTDILKRVGEKKGILAYAAKLYINDEEKAEALMIEYYEQCHVPSLKKHWGRNLVNDIIIYNVRYNCKQIIDLM